jgi:hypothetical protein
VHEAAVEEVIGCRIGVCFVKSPARLAFRVRAYDRDWEDRGEVSEMADEVCAMGKGAE